MICGLYYTDSAPAGIALMAIYGLENRNIGALYTKTQVKIILCLADK